MSAMHDDERPLGSLLDEWGAQSAPEGFSCAVVRASEAEKRARSSRQSTRGVVIPLLLAALFVSVGAAAAFSQRVRDPVRLGQHASTEAPSVGNKQVQRVSFQYTQQYGMAEPDLGAHAPKTERPRIARPTTIQRTSAAPANEAVEAEPPVVIPPRTVHFPHCECGTSGVVCACSD